MSEGTHDPAAWIGRKETRTDTIGVERARAFAATLDLDTDALAPDDALPTLWHWLYFWTITPRSQLGRDGHARLGEFLPDLGDVRRMWAGSRLSFLKPLRLGDDARRTSEIVKVEEKEGRAGLLVFVTVAHEIAGSEGPCIAEEHDIVYREMPAAGGSAPARQPEAAPEASNRAEAWTPDPTMLFRYSALTFNGHRIHYDDPYVREVESYPGLVVHGPLLATLMAGAAERHRGATLTNFAFRGVSPAFADETLSVRVADDGDAARLWIAGSDGRLVTRGDAGWQVPNY